MKEEEMKGIPVKRIEDMIEKCHHLLEQGNKNPEVARAYNYNIELYHTLTGGIYHLKDKK